MASELVRPTGFEPATRCLEDAAQVVSRRGHAAVSRIRAGLLMAWLRLNVSGFRSVLARGWHCRTWIARPPLGLVCAGH
jgi:hypothetical protein